MTFMRDRWFSSISGKGISGKKPGGFSGRKRQRIMPGPDALGVSEGVKGKESLQSCLGLQTPH